MATLEYRVTMDDVLHFQRDIEDSLEVTIVLELRVYIRLGKTLYAMKAHAYAGCPEGAGKLLATGTAAYPTRSNQTFPGACLAALVNVEELASAQQWLAKIGEPYRNP